MLFSKRIRGIWRDGDFIHIQGEYDSVKFHIHEIKTLGIVDWTSDRRYTPDDLPLRRANLIFTLKSGRIRKCGVRRLTPRRWKWLLELIDDKHP